MIKCDTNCIGNEKLKKSNGNYKGLFLRSTQNSGFRKLGVLPRPVLDRIGKKGHPL